MKSRGCGCLTIAFWLLEFGLLGVAAVGRMADTQVKHAPGYADPLFELWPGFLLLVLAGALAGALLAVVSLVLGGGRHSVVNPFDHPVRLSPSLSPVLAQPDAPPVAQGTRCVQCGNSIKPGKHFCPHCGHRVGDPRKPS